MRAREIIVQQITGGAVGRKPTLQMAADILSALHAAGYRILAPGEVDALRKEADRAYCRFLDKMSSRECLGEEAKLQTGGFGQAELNAHRDARELLGVHKGIHRAIRALTDGEIS